MKFQPSQTVQKLDRNTYAVLDTGEIKEFDHGTTRADNLTSVAKSLKRLRELINTNVSDAQNCLWCTNTYKENMTDSNRLYTDFKKFNMRLQSYISKNKLPPYEYIVAMEPQGRGAWHAHLLLIFDRKAPFIPNDKLSKLWKHGFTRIRALDNIDNVGAYLTAYLGDMELSESIKYGVLTDRAKEVVSLNDQGEKQSKYYIKGARLKMYPKGFRLFRKSRGIKEPIVYETTNSDALQKLKSHELTYEKTISLQDKNTNFYNIINYRYYRKSKYKTNQNSNIDHSE
jgi:hypothetical protein